MKILFCNITYMNKYIGITDDDMPNRGGSWVVKNKDAHEQWNFLNVNGYCYGFVMNTGSQFNIERISKDAKRTSELDDVTVIWCAINDENDTVVVGWHEHATVYRNYQDAIVTPVYGIDRCYFTKAKAEYCYLLPERYRTFRIGRAATDGTGKGFGQSNTWYAESDYAKNKLIPVLLKFMENHRSKRVNYIEKDFNAPECSAQLTEKDYIKADEYFNNGEFFEYLPYGYRIFNETKSPDDAYNIALALSSLHQFDLAIDWYKKVCDIEGDSWDTNSKFPYLYQQCEKYELAIEHAKDLIGYDEVNDEDTRHEIYSIIADSSFSIGNVTEAIVWLDKIINETTDEDYKKHTTMVKENWLKCI